MKTDKRDYDRYKISIECKIGLSHGKTIPGIITDLSTQGAKISVNHFYLFYDFVQGETMFILIKDFFTVKQNVK